MNSCKISVGITGIGSYLPEKIVTNADLEKLVDTSDEWIKSRTGISERRIVAEDQATSDISIIAAKRAIEDAGLKPCDIDLIILGTITPDMPWPSTACIVQDKIGAVNAAAFDISAACSGFVYGMSVGMQFIQTGHYKRVLVIGAESMSRATNWQDRKTCVLFGDGAGAVVLEEVPDGYGIKSFELGSEGSGADLLGVYGGGSRTPASLETIENKAHFISMNGSEVYKFAVRVMADSTLRVLDKAGLNTSEVDYFVPHQANVRIVNASVKRLKIPIEKVKINIDRYANTSGATIPIALDEAVKEGKIKNGDNIVLVGFGAGLTWAASVIKWYSKK